MSKFKLSPLKIGGLVLAGAAYLISQELQRRDTEEFVEKAIAEREDARYTPPSID